MSQRSQTRNLRPRHNENNAFLQSNTQDEQQQNSRGVQSILSPPKLNATLAQMISSTPETQNRSLLQQTLIQQANNSWSLEDSPSSQPTPPGVDTSLPLTQDTSRSTAPREPMSAMTSDQKAIKFERCEDKKARFESHKAFLTKCLQEDLVPNGLSVYVEPSIGNQDDEFLKQFFEIQKECSRKLMQLTLEYCHQTVGHCEKMSKKLDDELRAEMDNNKYTKIRDSVQEKSNATSQQLQRTKHKKFNSLKYRPRNEKKKDQTAKVRAPQSREGPTDKNTDSNTVKESYASKLKENNGVQQIYDRTNRNNRNNQNPQQPKPLRQEAGSSRVTALQFPKNSTALFPIGEGETPLVLQLAQAQKETNTAIESLKNQFQQLLEHLQTQQNM